MSLQVKSFKEAKDEARILWATRIAETTFEQDDEALVNYIRRQIPLLGKAPWDACAEWTYGWCVKNMYLDMVQINAELEKKLAIAQEALEKYRKIPCADDTYYTLNFGEIDLTESKQAKYVQECIDTQKTTAGHALEKIKGGMG